MITVKLTTNDPDYKLQLIEQLLGMGGDVITMSVPEECADYEGLERVLAGGAGEAAQNQIERFAEVAAYLNTYKGTDRFVLSLQQQLRQYGRLSPKQVACVVRMLPAPGAPGEAVAVPEPVYSLKAGSTLILRKFLAKRVATDLGLTRPHPAVDVVAVKGETAKAYRAVIKLSAQRTTYCGCCGLHLENPESVAAGIGPICAEKYGISFGSSSLDELAEMLKTTGECEVWLPKSQIKDCITPTG